MEALGPILVVTSIPLILRWVPRNYAFGFRVAATLRSDAVWYDVNAFFARLGLALGLLMVAVEFLLPLAARRQTLWWMAALGMAVIVVVSWRRANRLARTAAGHRLAA